VLELGRLGVGVLDIGTGGVVWGDGWQNASSCAGPLISFALTPTGPHVDLLWLSQSGAAVIVDMHLPTDRPGIALRCRFDASSLGLSHRDLSRLRRHAHRSVNHRSSAWAIGGMVLLLAVCGWIVGGAEGARQAVNGGVPRANGFAISPELMYRWFGARLLRHAELPGLFHILTDVCRRARLSRLPDLYYLAAPESMNAYALGGPDGAAIVLTEGLLRSMTPGEVAGILAHEVAHISNNDAWAMNWAAALHRAIEWTSLTGLAVLRTQAASAGGPLAALLRAAPAIGQLLCLALSRVRELDADATALELTENSQGLVTALDKLERHHTGSPVLPVAAFEDGSTRLLRSHPATSERVGALLQLTH
jgi:heat shock protein HtpX